MEGLVKELMARIRDNDERLNLLRGILVVVLEKPELFSDKEVAYEIRQALWD